MVQIDSAKRYEIGRLKKDSLDSPETGEYLYTPVVLTGDQLQKAGIMTWNDFFEGAPANFHIGRLYHVFESRSQGDRKLISMGTITAIRNPNQQSNVGMNDDMKTFYNLGTQKDAPHNVKFFKDQLTEKDAEIKRLNSKLDELTKELMKAKEDKIFAEQELRRNIGLNDAINAKEEEYMRAIEKAQAQQAESSNRVLEGIMALATQGLSLWLQTQNKNGSMPNSPVINNQPISNNVPTNNPPLGDQINKMNDGDIVRLKNKDGIEEQWTIKTMGDKKVIVSQDGRMKTFN